jgi:hypothetical protein
MPSRPKVSIMVGRVTGVERGGLSRIVADGYTTKHLARLCRNPRELNQAFLQEGAESAEV